MLEQQEQLRALQGRQAALLAMQQSAEQAIAVMDDNGAGNVYFMFLEVRIISVFIDIVYVLQLLQRQLEVCPAGA